MNTLLDLEGDAKWIPNLGIDTVKLGDLIYYEGALLSIFVNQNNPTIFYLWKWIDADQYHNRWWVQQMDLYELIKFFNKEISLRLLMANVNISYIVDINNNIEISSSHIIPTHSIPANIFPSFDSMFDEKIYSDFATDFCKRLHSIIKSNGRAFHNVIHEEDIEEMLDFRTRRKKCNLTLRQVEDMTGYSNSYLCQLENGKISKPSFDVVMTLHNLYASEMSKKIIGDNFTFPYINELKHVEKIRSLIRDHRRKKTPDNEILFDILSIVQKPD